MSELLEAAKAVIARWDAHHVVVDGTLIAALRAAVERAEKQVVVGFEGWFDKNIEGQFDVGIYKSSKAAWTAGQQAEREKIKDIIKGQASGGWVRCCNQILEMIDDE